MAQYLDVPLGCVKLFWTTGEPIDLPQHLALVALDDGGDAGRPYTLDSGVCLLSPVVSAAATGSASQSAATSDVGSQRTTDTRPNLARESNSWGVLSTHFGLPTVTTLSTEQRQRLSLEWLRSAQGEHASVASFARHALSLLGVGAPPRLLRAVQRAGEDEVRHAEICFALAQAYCPGSSGASFAPAPFPFPGPIELERSLVAIAAGCTLEGCCNETSAALLLAALVAACADPCVRQARESIMHDEAYHAALAWQTVRWCLGAATSRGPADCEADTKQAIQQAIQAACMRFAATCRCSGVESTLDHPHQDPDAWMLAHGHASKQLRQQLRRDFACLVLPLMLACLAGQLEPLQCVTKAQAAVRAEYRHPLLSAPAVDAVAQCVASIITMAFN